MRVGTIAGIQLKLNKYFLILLLLFFLGGVMTKGLILFSLVLLHELAHVLVARYLGIEVLEIEFLPFGGVARLGEALELKPDIDWKVAIAGPLVNGSLAIAFFLFPMLEIIPQDFWQSSEFLFMERVNLMLLIFNLLPALPLDGGRIYRAIMVRRIGLLEATEVAASMGIGLAFILIILGLVGLYYELTGLDFFVIAIFLLFAARQEKQKAMYVFLKSLIFKKEELARLGIVPARTVAARGDIPLQEITKGFLPKHYHLIYILKEDYGVAGMVTETEVIGKVLSQGPFMRLEELLKQ